MQPSLVYEYKEYKKQLSSDQRANLLKWVEALESGKYKQSRGVLRNKNGYCCLGVACEVLKIPSIKCVDNNVSYYSYGYNKDVVSLPIEAVRQLGIGTWGILPNPIQMPNGKVYKALSELNDTSRYGFKTIAKVIRQVWLNEDVKIK